MNEEIREDMPLVDGESWVDLRLYDQCWFDRGRPGWYIFLWWLVQGVVFPLSPQPFHFLRRGLLRFFGAKVGVGVMIRPTARFTYPWKVEIGDYSWIGDDVVFYSLDWIKVGRHCVISQKCYLCTGSHDFTDPAFGLITGEIVVGNGVWVAADCFVAAGVIVGSNSMIGARSSVFKSMPAGMVCWGCPCQVRYERVMKKSV